MSPLLITSSTPRHSMERVIPLRTAMSFLRPHVVETSSEDLPRIPLSIALRSFENMIADRRSLRSSERILNPVVIPAPSLFELPHVDLTHVAK
jgi:hypothetical protein